VLTCTPPSSSSFATATNNPHPLTQGAAATTNTGTKTLIHGYPPTPSSSASTSSSNMLRICFPVPSRTTGHQVGFLFRPQIVIFGPENSQRGPRCPLINKGTGTNHGKIYKIVKS
jgi:hypothetical protein